MHWRKASHEVVDLPTLGSGSLRYPHLGMRPPRGRQTGMKIDPPRAARAPLRSTRSACN